MIENKFIEKLYLSFMNDDGNAIFESFYAFQNRTRPIVIFLMGSLWVAAIIFLEKIPSIVDFATPESMELHIFFAGMLLFVLSAYVLYFFFYILVYKSFKVGVFYPMFIFTRELCINEFKREYKDMKKVYNALYRLRKEHADIKTKEDFDIYFSFEK